MKLTKFIREAFVRGVMNDVPKVDYQAKADALVRKTMREAMPEGLRKMVEDGGDVLNWIKTAYVSTPGNGISSVNTYCQSQSNWIQFHRPAVWRQLEDIDKAALDQNKRHADLRAKLMGAANSVTTRKALVELLPEFEKYLPADAPAATRNLPMIVGVVDDFKKAGWPGKVKK